MKNSFSVATQRPLSAHSFGAGVNSDGGAEDDDDEFAFKAPAKAPALVRFDNFCCFCVSRDLIPVALCPRSADGGHPHRVCRQIPASLPSETAAIARLNRYFCCSRRPWRRRMRKLH